MINKFTTSVGEHIIVRGEEFIVQKTEKLGDDNSYRITAMGVSELTRGHTFIFRTDLESPDEIKKLEPKNTVFVEDNSANARKTIVFLENAVRGSYGYFDDYDPDNTAENTSETDSGGNAQVFVADRCAADCLPYQYEPFYKILKLPRPRFLIADAVGLGKTVEIGIILAEMIHRGRGQRILVCTMKSILTQFQEDIWNRFAIPLTRLDSLGVERIRQQVPIGANPFNYVDRVIISIDTLKNDVKFKNYLENTHWDIVVVDEIHTAANATTQRGELVKLLSDRCDSLIFASATPHNGKPESFAGIMRMLEPSLVPVGWDYQIDNKDEEQKRVYQDLLDLWRSYFVRRSKQDVGKEAGEQFRERKIIPLEFRLNQNEIAFLKLQQKLKSLVLKEWSDNSSGKVRDSTQLFPVTLFKSFLSSPVAACETIKNRLKRLNVKLSSYGSSDAPDLRQEIRDLEDLRSVLDSEASLSGRANDTRYQRFLAELRKIGWKGDAKSPRIVVFTEREETLKYLRDAVIADFGLEYEAENFLVSSAADEAITGKTAKTKGRGRKNAGSNDDSNAAGIYSPGNRNRVVKIFSGKMTDTEAQSLVENFSLEKSSIRMLITTDAGAVGINLHFFCHIMFNYDIPWSLITLDQRNGRIDRYGQKESPEIYYLIARTSDQKFDNESLTETRRNFRDDCKENNREPLSIHEDQMTDLRIISRLISKEDEVHKTLHGEASAVMSLYDTRKEEERTFKAVAEEDEGFLEHPAEDTEAKDDFIEFLLAGGGEDGGEDGNDAASLTDDLGLFSEARQVQKSSRRLSFYDSKGGERENTFRFYKDLFEQLNNYSPDEGGLAEGEKTVYDREKIVRIDIQKSESLRDCVTDFLPGECVPREGIMKFSSDIDDLKNAIAKARNSTLDNHRWSELNVLYAQHPVMNYYISLFDSLIGREIALAVSTPEVPEDEVWFFCHGTVPNVTGAPVINEFYVARSRYVQKEDPEQPDELGDFAIVNSLDLLNKEEGAFLRKPAFEARNFAAGELAFIQENFSEAYGSIEVWEYFKERSEQAEKQLMKAKELQLKHLDKWRMLSESNIAASRGLIAKREKLQKDTVAEYERCRNSYDSFYSLKSIGDSTGPENIAIRVLAVFSNITAHFDK